MLTPASGKENEFYKYQEISSSRDYCGEIEVQSGKSCDGTSKSLSSTHLDTFSSTNRKTIEHQVPLTNPKKPTTKFGANKMTCPRDLKSESVWPDAEKCFSKMLKLNLRDSSHPGNLSEHDTVDG